MFSHLHFFAKYLHCPDDFWLFPWYQEQPYPSLDFLHISWHSELLSKETFLKLKDWCFGEKKKKKKTFVPDI